MKMQYLTLESHLDGLISIVDITEKGSVYSKTVLEIAWIEA